MKKNSFVEGTVIATFAIVIVKILGMLYVIPFYKIVGSQGGALYSYAYNIYLIFLGISSAGLPNAISKIISEYNSIEDFDAKNRAYNIAKKMLMVISILAFLILFIFAEEIGHLIIGNITGGNTFEDVAFVIRCVAPAVLIIPFLSVTKGYLQGHKYVSPSSVSQVIEQVVRIFVILVGSYLTLNIFRGTLTLAVGIAVSGAFFGGIFAYLYLRHNINKNKDLLFMKNDKESVISDKEIFKKIIKYAVPFVIINIVTNLYNFTDQWLILRTIYNLGFDGPTVEYVASSISTWSPKICMIINSMAMGMTISLIPTIVSAYTKNDRKEVNDKINRSISMVVYVSLPLMLGLMILSKEVWYIFYNNENSLFNVYGSEILKMAVVSALFSNVYMIISTILQSLNKFKSVYLVSITGFITNALLDIPLMHLFYNLKIDAFLGSIMASIIGFSLSVLIGIILLKKEKVNFKFTFKTLLKILIPGISMVLFLILFNNIFQINVTSKMIAILKVFINAILGGIIYIGLSFKLGLVKDIFGQDMAKKIIKKLTLGKLGK